MGFGRHCRLFKTVPAIVFGTSALLFGADGIESSGEFARNPLKELTDVPGPVFLGKDFALVGVARRDDDFLRETFGLRKFAFDGKEDAAFGDRANTPAFLPRGGRRLGNYFHDLAGKLDPGTARSLRNYASRILPATDGRWIVAGRVGGDEGKVFPALLQLKSDGTVDGDFAKAGRTVLPARHRSNGVTAAALVGAKEPKVWLGLPATRGLSVGRLDGKGSLDATFGDDGYTLVELEGYDTAWPQRILGQDDGSAFVVACASSGGRKHVVVTRLTAQGKVDAAKFGDKGIVFLNQTSCDTWVYAPKTTARSSGYYFSADTWAVTASRGGVVLAVDGQDASGDREDPIFGARSLGWKKDVAGLVRFSSDGTVDATFGDAGVVRLEGPGKARINVAGLGSGKDGVLWVAAVVRGAKASSLAWTRIDAKGKPLAWSRPGGKSAAKIDGDWLVFPAEDGRELTVRAFRVDETKGIAFGFSAAREVPADVPLNWKLWQVSE